MRAALLLACLACSGCLSLSGEFGSRIPIERIPDIRNGETTRAEIVAWFGPPSAFFSPSFLDVILEDEEDLATPAPLLDDVYTYRYIENDTRVFFVPIFYAQVRGGATLETLTVFFDERGLVEYHAYRRDATGPARNR
jgi:hypothetical protein